MSPPHAPAAAAPRDVLVSASAAARLAAARAFVLSFAAPAEVLVVGATRPAADDLAREVTRERGASFGIHRFSLLQLAARMAAPELARRGLAPMSPLAAEAVAARAVALVEERGDLGYFAPVARFPGFARALAATVGEARAAGLAAAALAGSTPPGPDLAGLLAEFARQADAAGLADRALLLELAAAAARRPEAPFAGCPLLLLDVAVDSIAAADFVAALASQAAGLALTVAAGDERTLSLLGDALAIEPRDLPPAGGGSRSRLQAFLFSQERPPAAAADDEVRFFSAPGEARECVEIARYVLDQARAGVPFDRMAVFLRAPRVYGPLLETAFRRAGVPAYFARGSRRPDPAGRALLALLACREEGLSARRFAEYLSLGQVPADPAEVAAADRGDAVPPPADDEALRQLLAAAAPPAAVEETSEPPARLRAPWKWEAMLVDAAVIGGRERWQRRLAGLAADLRLRMAEVRADDPDSPRAAGIERDLENLEQLRLFALPLIERLDSLPSPGLWSEWLPALHALAAAALWQPARVRRVLAELEPMGSVGPVSVAEVTRVLAERLTTLEHDPPAQRQGRVFVAPAADARGRAFDVVFVPGLAERIFPQRPREDPLLLDGLRRELGAALRTQEHRGQDERLLLRLAVGAAGQRLYLSYPRVEVAEARPRVTSFYGLDVVRATRGEIPDFEALEREAEAAANARLSWPAPAEPARAIDAVEHDLAVLQPLLHAAEPSAVTGRARYLLTANPWLARSLQTRYARWESVEWRRQDGLIDPPPAVRELLAAHSLRRRPYSASALQRFAVCPYQFLLAAIYRFAPREEPAALEDVDPLTRGRFFHEAQAETFRALERAGLLPPRPQVLDACTAELDRVIGELAASYREALAPAIERVWEDEILSLRADLHAWLRRLAAAGDGWRPRYFELAFGLPLDATRDPASSAEPVILEGGWMLRGSIDLVEESAGGEEFRVTDHKTGKDSTRRGLVIGRGEVLQPVLYALAVEAAKGKPVRESRLYYCTTRGGFALQPVKIDHFARQKAQAVLETIERAVATGFFPPAPRADACRYCDFHLVCGPYEEIRAARKDRRPLEWLEALRRID